MVQHHTGDSFIKIVYAKVRSNGRIEMVPLNLMLMVPLSTLMTLYMPI